MSEAQRLTLINEAIEINPDKLNIDTSQELGKVSVADRIPALHSKMFQCCRVIMEQYTERRTSFREGIRLKSP